MPLNYSKPFEVRDSRNGSWYWVHTHVLRDPRLTMSEKVIYSTIASYANQYQTAFPSITKMSQDSGVTERHVYRCLLTLKAYNYISIENKRGKANVYTLQKTTPDIKSPLTSSQVTPDIRDRGTPDKSAVRTRTSITRSNNNNNNEQPQKNSDEFSLIKNQLGIKNPVKGVSNEFQAEAYRIILALGIPDKRKSAYFKAVKEEDRNFVLQAYSFAEDYPDATSRDNMFFWKLHALKKAYATNKARIAT